MNSIIFEKMKRVFTSIVACEKIQCNMYCKISDTVPTGI